jgi:two-component system, LytTR family, response regulator
MAMDKFTYLVIENAPDVCEGIIRRMDSFEKWESSGYCIGVKEATQKIQDIRPHLLYLDWSLNGGSAFEILQQVQNMPDYNPYIIFNTGFQKDNPEIPQEIINNYKVDKYIVKPLWESLRNNLPSYLKEAEVKAQSAIEKLQIVWLEDDAGVRIAIPLDALICICQHPIDSRSRTFYLDGTQKEINVPLQWQKCYELLDRNKIDYFITKSRSHLVIKKYIGKFEKPFVRLRNFPAKIEVVKESIKAFEKWLIK